MGRIMQVAWQGVQTRNALAINRLARQRSTGCRLAGAFQVIARSPSPSDSERVTARFEPRPGGIAVRDRIASPVARALHEQGWFGCLAGLAEFLDGN